MFNVIVTKKAMKGIEKMPHTIQLTMAHLIEDLIQNGPILRNWSNFSKIGINQYHCHLAYKWVACWEYQKNTITIEVYYAGSRENAPY